MKGTFRRNLKDFANNRCRDRDRGHPIRKKAERNFVSSELVAKKNKSIPDNWQKFASMVSISSGGKIIKFNPYGYQVDLVKSIEDNDNTIICKSRQLGISETLCAYVLWRALREPGFKAVIYSKTQDDSSELGKRIKDMAISLGTNCPKITSSSAKKIVFKGLGSIYLLPVTEKSARGIPSVSVLVMDEMAFIDKAEGVYQGAVPTLSNVPDAKIILNSTPNGKTGLYWRLLIGGGKDELKKINTNLDEIRRPSSEILKSRGEMEVTQSDGENNVVPFHRPDLHYRLYLNEKKSWNKVLLHWRCHPRYGKDPNWAEKTREEKELTEAQWNQEFELSFAEGDQNVFKLELVEAAAFGSYRYKPLQSALYLLTIDPSFGGKDYFVAQIWDVSSPTMVRLVRQYRQSHKSKNFNIENVISLAEEWGVCGIAIETNSGGALIAEDIKDSFPGMEIFEFCTTEKSKILNTDRLVLMMERQQLSFPKECEIFGELANFKQNEKGKREGANGFHDDTVMAASLMPQMLGKIHVSWVS